MRLNPVEFDGQAPIDGYGPGGFRVAGSWHPGGLILTPGARAGFAALTPEALAPVLAERSAIDVVLIGLGAEIAPLSASLRAPLEAAGLGVEAMATPPACRTYNVLLAEERRVAAVLVAV